MDLRTVGARGWRCAPHHFGIPPKATGSLCPAYSMPHHFPTWSDRPAPPIAGSAPEPFRLGHIGHSLASLRPAKHAGGLGPGQQWTRFLAPLHGNEPPTFAALRPVSLPVRRGTGPPTTAPKAGLLPQRRPTSIGDVHRVGRPSGAPLAVPYVLKTGRARRQTAPPMRPFHIQFAGARPRFVPVDGKPIFAPAAGVVKLVDTPDLGSGAVRCVGSSPSART